MTVNGSVEWQRHPWLAGSFGREGRHRSREVGERPLPAPTARAGNLAVKRPARPHRTAIEDQLLYCGERNGRMSAPGGPGPRAGSAAQLRAR